VLFAGPGLPYFRWDAFWSTALGRPAEPRMVIDFWQIFILPWFFFFFWLQQQKEASIESPELSRLALFTHNAIHFRILQASAFLGCASCSRTPCSLHITTIAFRWIHPALKKQKIPAGTSVP
jgi:hypothetical protein